MFRSSKLVATLAIALLALAPDSLRAGPAADIFDSLMAGQKPKTQISLPNPPEGLKAMLEPMISVQRVELRSYAIGAGARNEDLLKGYRSVLEAAGWQFRMLKSPGRGYDAVYSKDGPADFGEFLLIELEGREVMFFRAIGSKSKDSGPESAAAVSKKKPVPSSVSLMRITAFGPSLQYEAWTQEVVEVKKIQPTGGFSVPDIMAEGSTFHVTLPGQQQQFPSVGTDYSIHAPGRLSVAIESTGSPVTVRMDGAHGLTISAANASVTIVGAFTGGDHRINVVNKRAVLNLSSVKEGEMKVTATNADITVSLPQNSDLSLTAHAVAGKVTIKKPDQPEQTDNPCKFALGQGKAQLILEAVSGKITVNVRK